MKWTDGWAGEASYCPPARDWNRDLFQFYWGLKEGDRAVSAICLARQEM